MPLRRDPSLIPLSHDHHHGLMRVLLIRQALRAGAGLSEEAAATRDFCERSLVAHFAAEEEALFPLMRAASCAVGLLDVRVAEHDKLREMARALDASAEQLAAFADLLERHIRREERELFMEYQAHIPQAQRPAVEDEIRRLLNRPDDTGKSCDLPPRP